jgi:hypothetical protein
MKKRSGTLSCVSVALLLLCFVLPTREAHAQSTTRDATPLPDKTKAGAPKKKVMLIPFDPKMYMSDIDRSINRETKLKFTEIRDQFRWGIDNQLYGQFKPTYSVISLLKDTVKTKKDIQFIYQSTGYKYTVTQGKEKTEEKTPITNGQLTLPHQGEEERYMRTVINQPGLLLAMNKKYGAELFVFVSEVDMKSVPAIDGTHGREAWVHFTVYDLEGKQVGGGLAKVPFDTDQNEPKKIVSTVMASAAKAIYARAVPAPPVAKEVEGK